jgi:two-component system sensor histidine kinase/response regulator
MDVQMPVMDGYEATRQIRATPALAGQCVIAMTANVMAEDRMRCLKAGMDDFLTKPIYEAILYQTLAKWLPDTKPVIKPQHEETKVHGGFNFEVNNSTDLEKEASYL